MQILKKIITIAKLHQNFIYYRQNFKLVALLSNVGMPKKTKPYLCDYKNLVECFTLENEIDTKIFADGC